VAVTRDRLAFPEEIDWSAGNVYRTDRARAVETRSVGIPVAGAGAHFAYVAGANSPARGGEVSLPVVLGPLVTEGVDASLLPVVGPVRHFLPQDEGSDAPGAEAGPVLDDPRAFAYVEEPGLCNAGRAFPGGAYTRVAVGLSSEATAGGVSALSDGGLAPGFSSTDVSALQTRFALAAGGETEAVLSNLAPGGRYELYSFGASSTAGEDAGVAEVAGVIDRRFLRVPGDFPSAGNVSLLQTIPSAVSTLSAELAPTPVQGDPSDALQSFRASLVTVSGNVDLGPDPVGRLMQLRERFVGTGSVSGVARP
jgi:hypothetical protein